MNPSPDPRDRSYYLQRLVDQVPALLAYWDSDLRCRFANQAYQNWFGIEPATLIGRSIQDLLGPELFALNEPYIAAVLAGREQVFERIVPGPNGQQRHSLATYVPDVADGVVVGFLAQVAETTPLKDIERQLRISKSLLDRAGQVAGVGGWEVDLRTDLVVWSDHTRRIHDVEPSYRPTVAAWFNFYAPPARPVIAAAVDACMRDGTPWDLELPLITATGRKLWVRTFGEVEMEAGRPVRLIGAFQDITARRLIREDLYRERQLRSLSEEHARDLDRMLRERSEMLDVMAHEVRQPLNNASAALQSASAALRELGAASAVSARVTRAQNVMNTVLGSIDNTLAVASLLARPEPIKRVDTDVDTMLRVAILDLRPDERHRVRIDRETNTRTASMDMSLMRLALRNLLSNAMRYSAADAEVVVRIADSDEALALVIDVVDAGPGFDPGLLPHLFERGARHSVTTHQLHGLGLGLYIVRRVMELHGGQAMLIRNGVDGATIRLMVVQPLKD